MENATRHEVDYVPIASKCERQKIGLVLKLLQTRQVDLLPEANQS